MKWKKLSHNEILNGKGFFVSFNANPCEGISFFAGDTTEGETAIVKDGEFLILNGDLRKEYEKLVPKGFKACKEFFESKRETHGSSWTTPGVN